MAAPALLAGAVAHAVGPLPSLPCAGATAGDIRAHVGDPHTRRKITGLGEPAGARAVLLDIAPIALPDLAGGALPSGHTRWLSLYRYGPAAGKADFLVSGPIPCSAPETGRAGTVHLGGGGRGLPPRDRQRLRQGEGFAVRPDRRPGRDRPRGARWPGAARCGRTAQLPHGRACDTLPVIRAAVERYAPGLTDSIPTPAVRTGDCTVYNLDYAGGDIVTGAIGLRQTVFRPAPGGTPAGPRCRPPLLGGHPARTWVHGMCGLLAARSALRCEFGRPLPALGPVGAGTPAA